MILTDTHPIIWFSLGERKLGAKARDLINLGLEDETLSLSPISLWETSMLLRKGRISFELPIHEWTDVVIESGIQLAEITSEIAVAAGQLPGDIHGDPADRIIIATARALGCPVLTADRKLLSYSQAGHLRTVDARV